MATSKEVIYYLRPEGGTIATGEDYEGIEFVWAEPFTKEEYAAAFVKVDAAKATKEVALNNAKQSVLDKLGLTAEEIATLLA